MPPPGTMLGGAPIGGVGLSKVEAPVVHEYHLKVNGQKFGPFTALQVGQMAQAQQLQPAHTQVWRAGMTDWVAMPLMLELAHVLAPPAQQSSAMPPD